MISLFVCKSGPSNCCFFFHCWSVWWYYLRGQLQSSEHVPQHAARGDPQHGDGQEPVPLHVLPQVGSDALAARAPQRLPRALGRAGSSGPARLLRVRWDQKFLHGASGASRL